MTDNNRIPMDPESARIVVDQVVLYCRAAERDYQLEQGRALAHMFAWSITRPDDARSKPWWGDFMNELHAYVTKHRLGLGQEVTQ